jgi:hypothetical protein
VWWTLTYIATNQERVGNSFKAEIFLISRIGKTLKEYFPISLRQIVGIDGNGDKVELQACVGRKGNKDGSKLKSLPFTFSNRSGVSWAEAMRTMVFGKFMRVPPLNTRLIQ